MYCKLVRSQEGTSFRFLIITNGLGNNGYRKTHTTLVCKMSTALVICFDDNYTFFNDIKLKLLPFTHCQKNTAHCEWIHFVTFNINSKFKDMLSMMIPLQARNRQKEKGEVSCHPTEISLETEDRKNTQYLAINQSRVYIRGHSTGDCRDRKKPPWSMNTLRQNPHMIVLNLSHNQSSQEGLRACVSEVHPRHQYWV